jgi:hypothetical protein
MSLMLNEVEKDASLESAGLSGEGWGAFGSSGDGMGAQSAGTEGERRLHGSQSPCRGRVAAPRVITTTHG